MTGHEGKVAIHSTEPSLIPKAIDFIRSRTYFEKERLLRQYPELLSKEADHILEQIENHLLNAGNETGAEGISNWRDFLRTVKDSDFEVAMLEGIILRAVVGIIEQQEDILHLTSNHPELLSDRTDRAMVTVKRKLGGNKSPVAELLNAMGTAIQEQRNRKRPIRDEALKELDRLRHKPRAVSDLFK